MEASTFSLAAGLRRCRRFFAGHAPAAGRTADPRGVFRGQARRFTIAQILVHGFYAFLLYFAVTEVTELGSLADRSAFQPLWPVAWLNWAPVGSPGSASVAVRGLFFFYIATTFIGAVLAGSRTARIGVFVGLLEYVALKNSYGKIGHSLHLPLLVSLLLIFLPGGWDRPAPQASRRLRQSTLLVFWLCQAAVMLSYTMSGLIKVAAALWQVGHGERSAFSPGALSALVAQRLLQTHSQSLLGAWIIHHPWLTWPLMPAAVYLELFSFWIAFRPGLARPWAAALIFFHIGTFFTMTITFPQSCFLLALLFFSSPFSPATLRWRNVCLDVPLAGDILCFLQSRRRRRDEL